MEEENDNLEIQATEAENIIQKRILFIRGHKVMIDSDLASLYKVSTKVFNQAVKRNMERFPGDFMFQLSKEEKNELVTICDHLEKLKFSYNLPYAFTEHGIAMLSSVLNSKIAIQMNILIIRVFIKIKESLDNYKDLALKISEIEKNQIKDHAMLENVHEVVKHLLEPLPKPKEKVGFNVK
ncbi:MAG: ORF6N domain-containing protein [Patescibacteria group bacterium]